MEYLDTYDELGNFLGAYERGEVHEKGLWHKTVHCWVYDELGNIYFQVRGNSKKLYTTSSGHVDANESIEDAFIREIKEEIGLKVNYKDAQLIEISKWMSDTEKNGKIVKDRAFVHLHLLKIKSDNYNFSFNDGEVIAVARVNVFDAIKLFNNEVDSIKGEYIVSNVEEKEFRRDDFLCLSHETLMEKYGKILNAVKERV